MAKVKAGANAGTVYIRDTDVDNDDEQGIALEPGDYWEVPIPAGTTIDINTLELDVANSNDGVIIGYIAE